MEKDKFRMMLEVMGFDLEDIMLFMSDYYQNLGSIEDNLKEFREFVKGGDLDEKSI